MGSARKNRYFEYIFGAFVQKIVNNSLIWNFQSNTRTMSGAITWRWQDAAKLHRSTARGRQSWLMILEHLCKYLENCLS